MLLGSSKNMGDMSPSPFRCVDLKLPSAKSPATLHAPSGRAATIENHFSLSLAETIPCFSPPCGSKGYAIGSSNKDELSYRRELGLFDCVKEAWGNHWNFRTSPEDWWFPVACHIAKAIDRAAKSTYSGEKVRDLFVSHEGKEEIKVDLPVYDIYEIEYDTLFSRYSSEIRNRIKLPAFADCMQNDFSCTTPSQKIASEINLMASMQEFFSYHTGMCGCGIKALEMQGAQEDWDRLALKLRQVRKELDPIWEELGIYGDWFEHVDYVFKNLAKTYAHPDRRDVAKFWADILMHGTDFEYGPSGFDKTPVEAYNGWLVKFLTEREYLWKKDLNEDKTREKLKGINSVPMKLTFEYRSPKVSDSPDLIAGISGFSVVPPEETFNDVPSLQVTHMWAMMLPKGSPLLERYSGPR